MAAAVCCMHFPGDNDNITMLHVFCVCFFFQLIMEAVTACVLHVSTR